MIPVDLSGRTGLVLGIANRRSLAWAMAERLSQAGMRLFLTYQGERLKDGVEKLAASLPEASVLPCDVTDDAQLDQLLESVAAESSHLDVLVHSVAYANREDLTGEFAKTSRDGWRLALEISAYSLVALMRRAAPLMAAEQGQDGAPGDRGGSVLAMTYIAAERVIPNYNVMGSAKAALEHAVRQLAFELGPQAIRVNALSAGPVSTLSARGLGDFNVMLAHHRERACLKRNVTADEVADAALFLLSDLGRGVTGETLHVDGGYGIMGF